MRHHLRAGRTQRRAMRTQVALVLALTTATQVAAQASAFTFSYSANGAWQAGQPETVTFVLDRLVSDTLFVDAIYLSPLGAPAGTGRIRACANLLFDGAQKNAPCGAGFCTTVTCTTTIPSGYPAVNSFDVSAEWKDCKKMPLLDVPVPFCNGETSVDRAAPVHISSAGPASTTSASTSIAPATSSSIISSITSTSTSASTTASSTSSISSAASTSSAATPSSSSKVTAMASSSATSIATSAPVNANPDSSSSGSNTPAIIGGVIAALAVLFAGGGLLWRRARRDKQLDYEFETAKQRPFSLLKGGVPPLMNAPSNASMSQPSHFADNRDSYQAYPSLGRGPEMGYQYDPTAYGPPSPRMQNINMVHNVPAHVHPVATDRPLGLHIVN
ncbi:uncharacterized protein EV422DRAFT_535359 [Fimicolochytrium jonesii]|uniref:uncharacterized protein n=1 Tax=Fimicolochytrium jonesii TaxID=1396493 RepID=UPI0022FF3EDD|nr:uncharacterized protein EV422DRAFT_535359 [Fimicolochytrium jonesii]KAI8819165.1 hypothetical protein EV422DRAFT_535359 [Fimicolochytrium jonesii]